MICGNAEKGFTVKELIKHGERMMDNLGQFSLKEDIMQRFNLTGFSENIEVKIPEDQAIISYYC